MLSVPSRWPSKNVLLELQVWAQAHSRTPWPEWLLLGEAELEPRRVNGSPSRTSMPSSAKPGGDHLCHHTERTSSRITTNRKAKLREGAKRAESWSYRSLLETRHLVAPGQGAPSVLTWAELTSFSLETGLTWVFGKQLRVCSHDSVAVWGRGWRVEICTAG